MPRYLLSTHTVEGEQREPMSEEQMREMSQRVATTEQEMSAGGAWVFSARLHAPGERGDRQAHRGAPVCRLRRSARRWWLSGVSSTLRR
jgi:hypothetical protein